MKINSSSVAQDISNESVNDTSAQKFNLKKTELPKLTKARLIPITTYKLKDFAVKLTSSSNFKDAIIVDIAFILFVTAFPFFPFIVTLLALVGLFIATRYNSFLGLILLVVLSIFPLLYQSPPLAWIYAILLSAILIAGYMHYRTIIFLYSMIAAAFSPFGYFLIIPIFALAVLTISYKRAMIITAIFVFTVISISGISGLNNNVYIYYNTTAAYTNVKEYFPGVAYPLNKPMVNIQNFSSAISNSTNTAISLKTVGTTQNMIYALVYSMGNGIVYTLVDLSILFVSIFLMDNFVTYRRSRYKGTETALFSILYPVSFVISSLAATGTIKYSYSMFVSFGLTICGFYILELYNIKLVRVLDVKKQDIRMKFGEAFEELEANSTAETFESIGDYEEVKEELKEAVISPIEKKDISRAYNIAPSKGVLLFGPPGTGKTMLMRALANEVRGGFFYVKSGSLISSMAGDTERKIEDIFTIAKKNAPCVLFFDEIDSIASSREGAVDPVRRAALSELLVEIDGFQSTTGVVVVGATNMPEVIDKALIRPGRLNKILYIPPPDYKGRCEIFRLYLSKLPLSKDVNIEELAAKTERYTGADIKEICDSAAQYVAEEAIKNHKLLEITQEVLLDEIKLIKPSTTMSQLENYQAFKLEFERSTHKKETEENEKGIVLDDVIGLNDAKKAIIDAIQVPLMHPDLAKKYDIKPINGILLFGPPGVGKTMLVKAIANEEKENIAVIEINGSSILKSGYEAALGSIKDAFNKAKEHTPSIILIDEIDALAASRSSSIPGISLITTELLKQMDSVSSFSSLVVIGITNRPNDLDISILRPGRFDKLIFVKPPDKEGRIAMFKEYLSKAPVAADIDYVKLSSETEGYTGADIENICREAKSNALNKSIETGTEINITTQSVMDIIKKVKPSAPESSMLEYLKFITQFGQR
ncbi:MAG: AAA family ATPase [Candidatus Micrarchaeia archaeon]